jgi:K+/H+ antiporter YhaU regulatory subunit KhtT
VLAVYDVPEDTVDGLVDRMRLENYGFLRSAPRRSAPALPAAADLGSCRVPTGGGAAGRSIGELAVRTATGATVIAVRRAGRTCPNPGPDFVLQAGDDVAVVGSAVEQAAARRLLGGG